jgi:hypothetical protein
VLLGSTSHFSLLHTGRGTDGLLLEGVFYTSKTSFDYRILYGELDEFKELGAEVWCVSCETLMRAWF